MGNVNENTADFVEAASRPKRSRLSIYLGVFIAALIAYPIILLAAGQQPLALCIAVVIALSALIAVRLIRKRGRISLAIGVIAAPLLVAVCMSSFRYLTPLVKRQRSIDQLERAQIGYKSRLPRKMDHWMTDRAGNLVPVWLTNIIGKDCLTELRSIDGQLSDFQSIRYTAIDASNLRNLRLRKFDGGTHFQPQLVDWLNEHPTTYFTATIDNYTPEDAEALRGLERPFSAFIHVDLESGDLSALHSASMISLSGEELQKEDFDQLFTLTELSYLSLSVRQIPRGALSDLGQMPNLNQLEFNGVTLDSESLQGIVNSGVDFLSLTNTKLPDRKGIRPAPPDDSLRTLSLEGTSYQDTQQLVRLFNCSTLAFEGSLSEDQAQEMMESSSVTEIRVYGPQSYRNFKRDAEPSG